MAEEAARLTSPRISIIVPVYKVEQYLRRCLDSIAAQTFTDWECILIDDGSPDKSGAICDEYAARDARFRVIHQKNKGVSAARNAGLDAARGEWIGFVDSDDWIEEVLLQELKPFFEESADIITFDYYRVLGEKEYSFSGCLGDTTTDSIKHILSGKVFAFLWTKLFKKSIINKYDIYFHEDFNIIEDVVFCIEVLKHCKRIRHIPNNLYHYNTQNINSMTYSLNSEKINQIIHATEVIEQILTNNSEYECAIKQRKIVNKMWILTYCDVLKREYLQLYQSEKLYATPETKWKRKVFLFFSDHNLFFICQILLRKRVTDEKL